MILETNGRDGFELQVGVVPLEVVDVDTVELSVEEESVVIEDHRWTGKGFCLFELVFLKKAVIGRVGN